MKGHQEWKAFIHCVDCGKPLPRASFRGNRDEPRCHSCSVKHNIKIRKADGKIKRKVRGLMV